MTSLHPDPKKKFFHVISDHRWLAAAGCSWNLMGPTVMSKAKQEAHGLLPNIEVAILDSLLLHARLLIEFYTKDRKSLPGKGRSKRKLHSTDIFLVDFGGLSIDSSQKAELIKYRRPIEIHLLHLTVWRDTDTRKGNAAMFRPDWNREAIQITELILSALKYVSDQAGPWQQPFRDLYDASSARYRDRLSKWPEYLCEKRAMEEYLARLGM